MLCTPHIPKPARRILAGAALIGIVASGAAPGLANAEPKKQPVEVKCKPGALWVGPNDRVIAVCDKNGKWVKVLRLEAGQLGTVVIASAPMATMARDNAGSSGDVRCEEFGGGKPGDQKKLSETKVVNGKVIIVRTYTVICGDDGKWHEVARVTGSVLGVIHANGVLVAAGR